MNYQLLKQERTEAILHSLDKLGFASRSQLQEIHSLGSNRNACRVLKSLSPYLSHFREGENIYYLNKGGRDRIGSEKVRTRALNYRHTLMRNDVYIHFGQPKEWWIERQIVPSLVPDVLFVDNMGRYVFVEIDHTQKMKVNQDKIDRYQKLKDTGEFQRRYRHFPLLVFYTSTETRREKLSKMCGELQHQILTKKDLL